MQSRHKWLPLCWVPVSGNEKADNLAKQAVTSNGDYTQYPYKDYYPLIKKATFTVWQRELYNIMNNNKVRQIKDTVKRLSLSSQKERTEVILTRLRIGHTRLTHGHLMETQPAPYCNDWAVPLTIKHILTECPEYYEKRQRHFNSRYIELQHVLGEHPERKVEMKILISF